MTTTPNTDKWDDKTEYYRAKRSINSLSHEMDQELTQLQNLHKVELQTTLSTITTSLNTLKQDISYENRDNLKKAWDNFALRTEDGATKFLNTIQNEEGGQGRRYFHMLIMATQTLLQKKGFLKNGASTAGIEWIDGLNGPKTRAAIVAFKQKWNTDHRDDKFALTGDLKYSIGPKMIKALLEGADQHQRKDPDQQEQEQKKQEAIKQLETINKRTLTELINEYQPDIAKKIGDIAEQAGQNISEILQNKINIINIIKNPEYNNDVNTENKYSHSEINTLRTTTNTANKLVKTYQANNESQTDENYKKFVDILNIRIASANEYKKYRENKINNITNSKEFIKYIQSIKQALGNINPKNGKPMYENLPHFKKFKENPPEEDKIRTWILDFIDNNSDLQLLDGDNKPITTPSLTPNLKEIFSEDSDQMKEIFKELYDGEGKFDSNKIIYGDKGKDITSIDEKITISEEDPNPIITIDDNSSLEIKTSDLVISADGKTLNKYKGNTPSVTIPGKIETIGSCAFENNKTIQNVTIENTETITLKEQTFNNCTNLSHVTFNCQTVILDYGASQFFKNCSTDLILEFPRNVTFRNTNNAIIKKEQLNSYFGQTTTIRYK